MARVAVSRTIAAPREKVWAVLTDLTGAGRWNTAWAKIEITSDQTHGLGTTFRTHTASGDTFDFEVSEWDAPRRISLTPVREEQEHYAITLERHTFDLRPLDEDTTLVELAAHASARGIMGRIFALFFWPGHQKHGLDEALNGLAAIFEPSPEQETTNHIEQAAAPPDDR